MWKREFSQPRAQTPSLNRVSVRGHPHTGRCGRFAAASPSSSHKVQGSTAPNISAPKRQREEGLVQPRPVSRYGDTERSEFGSFLVWILSITRS